MLNFIIPLTYELNIYDLFIDNYYIECTHNNNNKIFTFTNFSLYTNKHKLIYQISSNIPLECLLDFFHNHKNLTIKKIYYFLIFKFLLKKKSKIPKETIKYYCSFNNEYYDLILRTRDYHISNNNEIIITDYIEYNVCLIIINETLIKSFIAIIDKNCLIENLCDIIIQSKIYENTRYENIHVILIGGSIDYIDIIIKIFITLKDLKLSKFICKTNLFNKKPLKRLKFNSVNMTIRKIRNNSSYYIEPERDNSDHIKNQNIQTALHRI